MIASCAGHSHVVGILLSKGASVSIAGDGGLSALLLSAWQGHLAVSKMLVNAGANMEAATTRGETPLFVAAQEGHLGVMRLLIEAGANLNSRHRLNGSTALCMAAQRGNKDAVKMLLDATANPLLTCKNPKTGQAYSPLDMAAQNGHSEVVHELIQRVGIGGCGGASGGVDALCSAALHKFNMMALLMDAGVVDSGKALATAALHGREASVKFLLQQMKGVEGAYVNSRDDHGKTPLLHAIGFECSSPSPRIARLLLDARADTTLAVTSMNSKGEVALNETPLACTSRMLREKNIAGKDATEDQLHRLEGIRRLLLRAEAVHAVSFLWPVDIPSMIGATEGASKKVATVTPLRTMLPILRRRARRPKVLLAALFRWVLRWRCYLMTSHAVFS